MALDEGRIRQIRVLRGAPCGATWAAAGQMTGLTVSEALVRIGLDTQFYCTADPSGWDPMYGHSPVHFAAEVHMAALRKALKVQCDIPAEKAPYVYKTADKRRWIS